MAPDTSVHMTLRLRILVFPDATGTWTARALEHDIAADGRTVDAAVEAVLTIARAHIRYDHRHNRAPLSTFGSAPQMYWSAFTRARLLAVVPPLDCGADMPAAEVSVAVAAERPSNARPRQTDAGLRPRA